MFVIEKAKVMGLREKSKRFKKKALKVLICIALILGLLAVWPSYNLASLQAEAAAAACLLSEEQAQAAFYEVDAFDENSLIRFHVIANSDCEQDQRLKYAVRDEILKKAAPILAQSSSLEESRQILHNLERELTETAQKVVTDWGKDYQVSYDYGRHAFPAKSYGTIVLPAGEYEAVKIKIGEAEGSNWWCVLFPPLCFVDVEESTSVPVDGKAAVPLDQIQNEQNQNKQNQNDKQANYSINAESDKPGTGIDQPKRHYKKVRFYLVEKLFG